MSSRGETAERPAQKRLRRLALVLIVTGLVLLAASSAYYAYGYMAGSNLDELSYSTVRPSSGVTEFSLADFMDAAAPDVVSSTLKSQSEAQVPGNTLDTQAPVVNEGSLESYDEAQSQQSITSGHVENSSESESAVGFQDQETTAPEAAVVASPGVDSPTTGSNTSSQAVGRAPALPRTEAVQVSSLNPGGVAVSGQVADQAQEAPEKPESEGGPPGATAEGVTPSQGDGAGSPSSDDLRVESSAPLSRTIPLLYHDPLPAFHMYIPAIGVDSEVEELTWKPKEDGYEWETPKWVVGHIPTSARPGEQGEGWYFGHLESYIRREGNVFQRLTEIPGMLQEGEIVRLVLQDPDRVYLYQVYKTDWVHEDDLRVTDSGQQDITLVTCVPRFVYDHRLLVTAALIGVGDR